MSNLKIGIACALIAAGVAAAVLTRDHWQGAPRVERGHAPAEEHDHAPHGAPPTLRLSEKGMQNIGFVPLEVTLSDYHKRLKLPAMVVERPGKSQQHIAAPLTGAVTKIHVVQGQAVEPGAPLFEMRLTHEELVNAQRDYLKTVASLAVADKEIARLMALGEGVVAGKRVLDLQYEKQQLESSLLADQQAMLLHGLSDEQVDHVRTTGRLLRDIVVRSPEPAHEPGLDQHEHLLAVQALSVSPGEQVEMGQELAVLADHCVLLVEASAFEDDAEAIRAAAQAGQAVSGTLLNRVAGAAPVGGLELLYVAGRIDPVSRAMKVYLRLPNEVTLDQTTPDGARFVEWRYKPGQRMQVGLVEETRPDQIVLPAAAVVDEGAEAYVYRQNGGAFEQASVRILARDSEQVVVANDGALFEGDVIAARGAYQIHLAIKNESSGGVDPHAGHNH